MMKCTIQGCPGEYVHSFVPHTVRSHGELVVISDVPAEVCDFCGDVTFSLETIQHIENILKERRKPDATVPMYQYA